jgi:predicted nucleic acid-binding protein
MTADERRQIEDAAQAAVAVSVRQVPQSLYVSVEAIARERIPRDPDDWPTVALALVLEAGIWTHDTEISRVWRADMDGGDVNGACPPPQ